MFPPLLLSSLSEFPPLFVLPEDDELPPLGPGTSGVGAQPASRVQKSAAARKSAASLCFMENLLIDQMTFFSSQLPFEKRMAKKRERNTQSRNIPPQMLSRWA